MTAQTSDEVARTLREYDPDRYLASLFLHADKRSAVQAVWAFAAEVATTSERVNEPGAGEIRLKWWADTLAGQEHGAVRANPVAAALLDAMAAYGLPAKALERLVAARRFDLYQDPMPDMPTFEGYAGETVSVLYQMAAQILNDGKPVESGDAAGHLGVAEALMGHLRALGYNAARARIFLPFEVFAGQGVQEQDLFAGTQSHALRQACGALLTKARGHADKAQAAIAKLPRDLRPAFATAALLNAYRKRLQKSADDPFTAPPASADWQKLWTMFWWLTLKG